MRLTPKQVRAALPRPVPETQRSNEDIKAEAAAELIRRERLGILGQNTVNQRRIVKLRKILSGG